MMGLKEYLKEKCEARRLSFKELAEKVGKSPHFFTNLLSGHSVPNPRRDLVYVSMAKSLNVPLIELTAAVERHLNSVEKTYQEPTVPAFFPDLQAACVRKVNDEKRLVHSINIEGFSLPLERILLLAISVLLWERDGSFLSLLRAQKLEPITSRGAVEEATAVFHDTSLVRELFMAIMVSTEARKTLSKIIDGKSWVIDSMLRVHAGKHFHSDTTVSLPHQRTISSAVRFMEGLADEDEERRQLLNDDMEVLNGIKTLGQLRRVVSIARLVNDSGPRAKLVLSQLETLNEHFSEIKNNCADEGANKE